MPVDPGSTAARLAAGVNATEAQQDQRMRSGSPAQHRRNDILAELRHRGLQDEAAFRGGLDRVLMLAPGGDVDVVAAEIAERHPGWFQPAPQPTASELIRRFQAGQTTVTPGS